MTFFFIMGAVIILRTVETPNNCEWFNEDEISFRENWTYTDTRQIYNIPKALLNEKNSTKQRYCDLKKLIDNH